MYRAEVVGTRAALPARREGLQAAGRHLDRAFEPRPLRRGSRRTLRQLTPLMDRLIVVSKAIERKIARRAAPALRSA